MNMMKEKTMAGKFEIYKDAGGDFRWRLKAGNGENVLASQGYSSKDAAVKGAESVQTNCSDPACFKKDTTDSGKFRFNMVAKNHQVIGVSQMYDSESGRDNGIGAVARAAEGASFIDTTEG